MAQAYTPGLKVRAKETVRKERRLPIKGEVIVEEGQRVTPDQVVARTDLPGDPVSINMANLMGLEPSEIADVMLPGEGDSIEEGEVMAKSRSFFGLFTREQKAPVTGTVEMISTVSGNVVLRKPPTPLEVKAYVSGVVAEVMPEEGVVVETRGAFIQGIFGVGGERQGEIKLVCDSPDDWVSADAVDESCSGKVLVVGSLATTDILHRAADVGASAVVAGGIIDEDLVEYLGYDIGVAITGQENVPLTVIVTEGFGPMRIAGKTFELLQEIEGRPGSVNGATQIRAGVMRPEIICPATVSAGMEPGADESESAGVEIGTPIRIIREPYFGELARVTELPPELREIESEAKVRILKAEIEDGTEVTVPRANVEIIEG